MKLNFKFISIIVLLLGLFCGTQASTFKPFVRSRYSLRWRKTTEMPKVWDSSTASSVNQETEKISLKPIDISENLADNTIHLTTVKPLLKTSTHSTDYDYYNNEVEEEHKN
ncbi:uncharacterized protein LOC119600925 [Lucilia sericata]|uniref:uncharacterized protein LOC119600925 n=1 Tax=Lucilia sericata TaxID=13632 RepID=UPI0018A838BA|nr:uncharacterized protein LOC119600925 [Lucilia sericata]